MTVEIQQHNFAFIVFLLCNIWAAMQTSLIQANFLFFSSLHGSFCPKIWIESLCGERRRVVVCQGKSLSCRIFWDVLKLCSVSLIFASTALLCETHSRGYETAEPSLGVTIPKCLPGQTSELEGHISGRRSQRTTLGETVSHDSPSTYWSAIINYFYRVYDLKVIVFYVA